MQLLDMSAEEELEVEAMAEEGVGWADVGEEIKHSKNVVMGLLFRACFPSHYGQ